MRLPGWLRSSRSVLALLLAVTSVPAVALMWVSWRLLEQDRALAVQRLQERLEHAADIAASALDRRLADLDAQLATFVTTPPAALPAGAVVLVSRASKIDAHPAGRILWIPAAPQGEDAAISRWQPGERLEFQERDYAGAAAAFRRLTTTTDVAVRAGAFVRLARTLRAAGRADAALEAYGQLHQLGTTRVGGVPSDLIAEYGSALLLHERADASSRARATRLLADLDRGRWTIDEGTYTFYRNEVVGWLGPVEAAPPAGMVALSAAAEHATRLIADQHDTTGAGRRRAFEIDGRHYVALWRFTPEAIATMVVGPDYVANQWRDVLAPPRLAIELSESGSPGRPVAVRTAADTGLPWTIRVSSVDPFNELAELSTQRRLLLTGLALVASLVVLGVYAVGRAVTRELAVARLQSNFVAAVSHEFRSPITALRHLTESLAAGTVSSEDRLRQYYAALARETERLHRLVDGLLDFGRMEAGRREYRFEPLDASALVERVVAEFSSDGNRPPHRIDIAGNGLAPSERAVRADGGALASALWNLLDNAVKYSPAGSTVRVELQRQDGRLLICVGDEGPGIAADERAGIFERFVRGSAARAGHVGGTGLGLAIVRHIVRAHGGEVTLDATTGRGSRFTIAIPAAGPASS